MKMLPLCLLLLCAFTTSKAIAQSPVLTIGPVDDAGVVQIRSKDTRQQLFATFSQAGNDVDVTRRVTFAVQPEGVLQIDSTGLVTPLADGDAVIRATQDDLTAEIKVTV